MILVEFLIIAFCIYMGVRAGGIALGMWGGLGLLLLAVLFGVVPGAPPIDVMLIIFAVCICASVMEVAGGLDYLVRIAARIIRANPKHVTIIAPVVGYIFTFLAGTGNIIYPLQPVIYEVAYSQGIRPERPMAGATVSSQLAIVASPISAATGAFLGLIVSYNMTDFGLADILKFTVPTTFAAVILTGFILMFYGKDLAKDKEYQERLAAGKILPPEPISDAPLKPTAKISVFIFLTAVALIVATGFFPELRTLPGQAKPVGMSLVIECVMLAVGAIMLTVTKADVAKVATSPTLKAGVISIASVFGLAWMSDSFIAANRQFFMDYAGTFVQSAPWAFAFVLFIMSGLLNSQGATTRGVMPLGIALGIDPWYLVAMFPAVCGVYLLPTTGPALAAVAFDRSGTTKIGKYVLNHSFQFPGVCMVTISVILGFIAVGCF